MRTKPSLTNRPVLGIACMVVSTAVASLNDVAVKWLTSQLPAGELVCLRAVAMLVVFPLIAQRDGGVFAIRVHDYRGQLLQAGLSLAAMLMFVVGLRTLPLAEAVALLFAGPLIATVLAAAVLRERIGWRRWSAVTVGFLGVLIILRPEAEAFVWAALLPIETQPPAQLATS